MKILCLATNRVYTNNTQQLFPLAIGSIAEVIFYGPGYVTEEILNKGVISFVKNTGMKFDFVYTDGMIFFWDEEKGTKPFNISYNYFSFNNLKKHINDMQDFFLNYEGKKLLYPNIDFYNVKETEVQLLEKVCPFLITWGSELLEYKKNLNDLKNETFSDKVNDNWINYIARNKEMVVSLPHIISESEFTFHPVVNRKYEITVPGVNYYSRKVINKIINKNKFIVNNRNTSYYQKLNIFILRKFTTRTNLKIFNQIFNNTIEDSKTAYTCGSGLDYLIRKFFEIPAKGTLLLCKPFKGFSEIGFIDKKNCIIVSPNNIEDKAKSILSNNVDLEQIAKEGQRMVLRNHSFMARANQLETSLKSILNKEFKGSYWEKGEFKLR